MEQFQQDQLVAVCAHDQPLGKRKRVSFEECLKYDFVGLNRGSSLLELNSRAAEQYGQVMRVRVQMRSFDATCHLINANLGIGVLPLAVVGDTKPHPLKVVQLREAWARRKRSAFPRLLRQQHYCFASISERSLRLRLADTD